MTNALLMIFILWSKALTPNAPRGNRGQEENNHELVKSPDEIKATGASELPDFYGVTYHPILPIPLLGYKKYTIH